MDGRAGPGPPEIGEDAAFIQFCRNFGFRQALLQKLAVDPAHRPDLIVWSGNQDDAISLKALVLTALQFGFHFAPFIEQGATQPEARRAALTIAELNQTALAREDLH